MCWLLPPSSQLACPFHRCIVAISTFVWSQHHTAVRRRRQSCSNSRGAQSTFHGPGASAHHSTEMYLLGGMSCLQAAAPHRECICVLHVWEWVLDQAGDRMRNRQPIQASRQPHLCGLRKANLEGLVASKGACLSRASSACCHSCGRAGGSGTPAGYPALAPVLRPMERLQACCCFGQAVILPSSTQSMQGCPCERSGWSGGRCRLAFSSVLGVWPSFLPARMRISQNT